MALARSLVALGVLLSALRAMPAQAETWPAWRGVAGSGVSSETNLPVQWSMDKNLVWKTDLPGRANASPAVTSDMIYLTSQTEDKSLWVFAIACKDGRVAWKVKVGSGTLAAQGPANLYAHRHNPAREIC